MDVNMKSKKGATHAARAVKVAYHHGDLPRALVAAAQRLIESGGFARLTLRAAAEAAGVSVAAPYRHFENREALLAAVLASGFRELARRTESARRAAPDALEGLIALGLAYVGYAADHPAIYRLMFGPECDKTSHPDLMAAGHEALAVLIDAVARCKAAGVIGDADVQQVALAGWSLSHGLASLHADGILGVSIPVEIETAARKLMVMMVDGVRPKSAPSSRSHRRHR
jgi:AcrR family transcriptional regulator